MASTRSRSPPTTTQDRRPAGRSGHHPQPAKVASAVKNARAFLRVQAEFGSFSDYMWRFVDGQPRINAWRTMSDIPAETDESRAMSRDLKARGFSFVGPTIFYAHMQAVGMVNDHVVDCFRYGELGGRNRRLEHVRQILAARGGALSLPILQRGRMA